MIRRLVKKFLIEPWAAIDAETESTPEADRKALIGGLVSCLMLVGLNYGAMSAGLQRRVAEWGVGRLELHPNWLPYPAWCYGGLIEHLYWVLACVTVYLIVPALTVKFVLRERLRDYGLSTEGFRRHLPIYLLLYVPVAICVGIVSFFPSFQQMYPFYRPAVEWTDLVIWEVCYLMHFFALEFFFRGFMLSTLKKRMGAWAIVAMTIPYTMIHFQKPLPETLGAIVAGVVLGTIALRTRSIWGGVMIHAGVALSMDLAALLHHLAAGGFWHPETTLFGSDLLF
ncbi:MAG: CPBP family intramembrane metalloprotease [Myxococcales bacterium]|nr:CPBP family intramembrane metalloprotease [Myxococcales bacterium]